MKTRNGFVSNSSSSSFIIAAESEMQEIQITIKANLKDLIQETIKTEEDIKNYIEDYWGYSTYEEAAEDDCARERWDEFRNALQNGKVIYIGCGDSEDCDNPLSMEVYCHGLRNIKMPSTIDVIEDCR
jgi:hypothetical protein